MLSLNVIRWSGLAAVLAGILWIEGGILLGLRPPGMPNGPYRESSDVSVLLIVSLPLIVAGLVGLYLRQAERSGQGAKTAFAVAVIGAVWFFAGLTLNMAGLTDAWHITVIPGFLVLVIGLLGSGVAILRANAWPRWAGALLMLASLLLLLFNTEDASAWLAVPFGIVWVVLGYTAQAIAQLRHPNILTIYDYGEAKDWAYIVMEYVPGGSLYDRLNPHTPFDGQQALKVVIPVAQALAFAHKQGIIHPDIKPANILLPSMDWPLLADFGLAKMRRSAIAVLTQPGQLVGTVAYAAPEQIQAGQIDARADIYGLGLVLYELLTGHLPFKAETDFELLMARLSDPPIPLRQANPAVSPLFAPIIEKALAQDPDDRYASIEELRCELLMVRHELSLIKPPRLEGNPIADQKSAGLKTEQLVGLNPINVRLNVQGTGQAILTAGRPELVIGRAHKNGAPDIDLGPYGAAKPACLAGTIASCARATAGLWKTWAAPTAHLSTGLRLLPSKR